MRRITEEADLRIYNQAFDRLSSYIDSGRISVKGESSGNSLKILELWIRELQQRTGNDVVVFVDSFHNIEVAGAEEVSQLVRASKWFRRYTETLGFTAVVTMECNKLGIYEKKPRISHLHGSRKMQFDLKFAGMVHNDVNADRNKAELFWVDEHDQGRRLRRPIIECIVDKNKLSSFKNSLFFQFFDGTASLVEITRTQALQLTEQGRLFDSYNMDEQYQIENVPEGQVFSSGILSIDSDGIYDT